MTTRETIIAVGMAICFALMMVFAVLVREASGEEKKTIRIIDSRPQLNCAVDHAQQRKMDYEKHCVGLHPKEEPCELYDEIQRVKLQASVITNAKRECLRDIRKCVEDVK